MIKITFFDSGRDSLTVHRATTDVYVFKTNSADGDINTVVTLSAEEAKRLIEFIQREHEDGGLVFCHTDIPENRVANNDSLFGFMEKVRIMRATACMEDLESARRIRDELFVELDDIIYKEAGKKYPY